ncbi:MAG: MBL fold metallo-hydrolase RNA specificity domain-containing protein [Candidatus Gracilibacteria bacterium]
MSNALDSSNNSDTNIKNGYKIIHHGGIGVGKERNLSGSCHELQASIEGRVTRILIDMGAYQGGGKIDRVMENIVDGVHTILFTHGHMDHIGSALAVTSSSECPQNIITTPGTKFVMNVALADAIKIADEFRKAKERKLRQDAEKIKLAVTFVNSFNKRKKGVIRNTSGDRVETTEQVESKNAQLELMKRILKENKVDPMDSKWYEKFTYVAPLEHTEEDLMELMNQVQTHGIHDGWRDIAPGISIRFDNAGHILGSVSITIRINYNGKDHNILFSGDLGSYKWDIHPNGLPTPPIDIPIETVITESTYGGFTRAPFAEDLQQYEKQLGEDVQKYDRIIHACFALDRLQMMLYRVIDAKKRGIIPEDTLVFVDSVMGSKYLMAYVKQALRQDDKNPPPKGSSIHSILDKDYKNKEKYKLHNFADYLDPNNGEYIVVDYTNRDAWMQTIGDKKAIYITSSGMMDGGPIEDYLRKFISDPKTVFYSPGFLVEETRGFNILQKQSEEWGDRTIDLGENGTYKINATFRQPKGFSGHGDSEDIQTWIRAISLTPDANVIIVHGNKDTGSQELKKLLIQNNGLKEEQIIVPDLGTSLIKVF